MKYLKLPEEQQAVMYINGDNITDDDYNRIIEHCKSKGYITKGKKYPVNYYNVVTAFDIETTKLENLNYTRDQSAMYKYFNICFCWQFAIDHIFIFGRYIHNFFNFIDTLQNKLNGGFVIWVHNLAYEFNNLADYFYNDDIFYRNQNQPVYIRRGDIEFRCSAQLTHKSLLQIGKDIDYNKLKGDFDYNIPRNEATELSPMEINYCYRDVMIIIKYITAETINYCTSEHKKINAVFLPYTQTGYPRRDMRKNWSDTAAGRAILAETALDKEMYLFNNLAFYGGYTHANYRRIGLPLRISDGVTVRHKDIVSAYPAYMLLEEYPYNLAWASILNKDLYLRNLYRPHYAQIANLTLEGVRLKKGHIPYLPATEKCSYLNGIIENGKFVIADKINITLNDVDMRLVLLNYDIDDIKVNKMLFGIKKRLPHNVIDTVLKYFNGKTTLKGVQGKEYEYNLSKAKLNSLYGLTASQLIHNQFEMDKDYKTVVTGTEYEAANVLPYQWAGYITAYVRNVIYGCISAMSDKNNFIYSDTDSIFYVDNPETNAYIEQYNTDIKNRLKLLSKEYFNIFPANPKGEIQYLGLLLDERDDITEFCAIGAKRYYIKHSNGLYDVTFSGLSATKVIKATKTRKARNGYNTQRLLDLYGGELSTAFTEIKERSIHLPYIEGVDKLSNYNVRSDFTGELNGVKYKRPCSFVLYPVDTTLALNKDLKIFINSELSVELF